MKKLTTVGIIVLISILLYNVLVPSISIWNSDKGCCSIHLDKLSGNLTYTEWESGEIIYVRDLDEQDYDFEVEALMEYCYKNHYYE